MDKIERILTEVTISAAIIMIIFRVLIWLNITPQEVLQWLS